MKKVLLLGGFLAAGVLSSVAFVAPKTYDNASFQGISPNGQYLVSSLYGTVILYDLTNGTEQEFLVDDVSGEYYDVGLGNCISNTGILLGHTSYEYRPTYWDGKEWKELDLDGREVAAGWYINGITPDGSRICGSIGNAEIDLNQDNTMLLPAIWDRQADGTYGKLVELPHPDTDFLGSVPQYITANYISEDGKVVAGQIVDCTGRFNWPIVYIEGADGKWTYKLLVENLFNPEGIVLPENPGEGPVMPSDLDYMSGEEVAAYQDAYNTWANNGYTGDMPSAADFMTPEHKAAYEAAIEQWKADFAAYSEKSDAYYETFDAIIASTPAFEFNDVHMTPDGKKFISSTMTSVEVPGSWFPQTSYTPWVIDIESGEVTKYDGGTESLIVCCVPNNDVILASNGVGTVPMLGYQLKDGKVTPIQDVISADSPELATWIKENMTHTLETYDAEKDEFANVDMLVTGMPYASSDFGVVAMWNDAPWDDYKFAFGYIFDMSNYSGVSDAVADANVKVWVADGTLHVEGDVNAVAVYDIAGRCVFNAGVDGAASCSLDKGVYIVNASTAGGMYTTKVAN